MEKLSMSASFLYFSPGYSGSTHLWDFYFLCHHHDKYEIYPWLNVSMKNGAFSKQQHP